MKGAVRANRRRKERSAMGAKQRDEMTKLGGDRGGGRGGVGGERVRRTQGEYESLRRTDASSLLTSLSV